MKCECENVPMTDEKSLCEGDIKLRRSMTAYHFEGDINSKEDPNREFYSCETHWHEYREYWKSMWDEYHSSIL